VDFSYKGSGYFIADISASRMGDLYMPGEEYYLVLSESTLKKVLLPLVAFAAGSLVGGALFHMIPASLAKMPAPLSYLILIGDGLHNFLGGMSIAGVFLMDVQWSSPTRHTPLRPAGP
jgi:hypothetical protein